MSDYINKIYLLKEKVSALVAVNLCQQTGFKEIALLLEIPTYGGFISDYAPSFFVSDPEKLSTWEKVKEHDWLRKDFMSSCYMNDEMVVRQWETAIDKQCLRLMERIPLSEQLRQKVHPWMKRIALEYLSYCRRQEVIFGVSRYFLMNIFTRGDWKEDARLDEKKLAQRLLEDERLTVLQRYRIACVYCLHIHIPRFWERLTEDEKKLTSGDDKCSISKETHGLVLLWSRYMNTNKEGKVALQKAAATQAISYGNRAALMVCWKEFQEDIRKMMVINGALESLRQWQNMDESFVKEDLVSNRLPWELSADSVKCINLPSYYCELIHYFLSQMDEEQQLLFLKKAFQSKYCNQGKDHKSVLECFLDWPQQDNFVPTINRLWGIIPKDKYGQCLLALASKYIGNDKKEKPCYDYESMLKVVWEKTPEEYKQYVFSDKNVGYSVINEGNILLSQLLEGDEDLFKLIFSDQPQQERQAMMLSEVGENMCSTLAQKEKWSFVNWLLEKCLTEEEIQSFKKRFIQSKCGCILCLDTLKENHNKLGEDLLNWSLESDVEKKQYKDELISGSYCLYVCKSLLCEGKFVEVECIINFCLSSDEKKEQFKVLFAQRACSALLENHTWVDDCVWEQMDAIIAWSVDTEEKIRDFKRDLFSNIGIDIHHQYLFFQTLWRKVKRFYQWFDLSPEDIKQLKKDTLFSPVVIEHIYETLPEYTNTLVASLLWCITNQEMVINLKKEVEKTYITGVLDEKKKEEETVIDPEKNERQKMEKEWLEGLIDKLLEGFKKEVQNKTSREEGRGEKEPL